ncbi:MAG: ATP-binding protein [Ketobacter sp.]
MEKILLVEDSKSFSAILSRTIATEWNLEVVTAFSLEQTKEALQQHRGTLVLAIIDLNLPDAPNGEAVDLVLAESVPGVVFTAQLNDKLRDSILSKGVADYVLKQGAYNISYVVNMVGRLLKNRDIQALVVSSDAAKRHQIGRWLSMQNLQVLEAQNGEEALALLAREKSLRAVIVDFGIEDIPSFSLISRMRESSSAEELAIIGISNVNDRSVGIHFVKSGASDVLVYPFPPEELHCRVNRSLELIEQFFRLKELNAQKNKLMGMAAHDIRGPVGNMSMAGRMLRSDKISAAKRDELFDIIQHAGDDLMRLLNELLDVSAIESGQLRLRTSEFNLAQLMGKRVRFYQTAAQQKNIRLVIQPTEDCWVHGDEGRLGQVIDNLISNAIKYSGNDTEVTLSLSRGQDQVTLSVEDEGVGIPENESGRLFNAYSDISSVPTAGESSTGLGLAICKTIVQQHKGSIGITPGRNKGCHFFFTVPTAR